LLVVFLNLEHFQQIHAQPLGFVSFVSEHKIACLIQSHWHGDYDQNY
jgi:hypothetical protein